MSMDNITITGIRPADEEHKKKLAAYKACKEANIKIPDELQEFFNYDEPNDLGTETDLTNERYYDVLKEDYVDGCIIHLDLLPPSVKYIKFRKHY